MLVISFFAILFGKFLKVSTMKNSKKIFFLAILFININIHAQITVQPQILFDPSECINTFQYELNGQLDDKTINNITQYMYSKKGICRVSIDPNRHLIFIYTTNIVDEKSIASLVRYAKNFFVNEECNHDHKTRQE